MTSVPRIRRDEADGAVQVFAVVPMCEGFHPRLSIGLFRKTLGRPFWPVFAGPEQRFRVRVVIADTRATVGRGDTQLFHRHFHRGTLHRATVVSVQNQGTHEAALGQNCLPDQNGC